MRDRKMKTKKDLEKKLIRTDYLQARLYLLCNFISLMLITAYSIMMLSPTVLNVLPEGGDSRKQVGMIFVLTLTGCLFFTIYATSLFFRGKSKQIGLLMALGASGKQLSHMLYREMLVLSVFSSACGIAAGFPFVWLLWNGFRKLIVDSEEMRLKIDFRCMGISLLFMLLTVTLACVAARWYLARTDILDTLLEEHKNEPIKEPGKWCGPVGIVLLFAGAVIGYEAPAIYINMEQAMPPVWINLFYAPVFAGLYMIMLHTVVNGWHLKKKTAYKNIISRSMMKFQGKQTVNNLLVSTVLIAGGVFGIFYIPMLGTGRASSVLERPYDYLYHYREDQKVPERDEVEKMAASHGISITGWKEAPYLTLGVDGKKEIMEEDGRHFHYEYREYYMESKFLSETEFEELTGQAVSIAPGSFLAVSNDSETGTYYVVTKDSILTNMATRETLHVKFAGFAHYEMLTDQKGYHILNDEDYAKISKGLTPEWKGIIDAFCVTEKDSYAFANELFERFVDSFDKSCELPIYYDRVAKTAEEEQGDVYWGDTDDMTDISFSKTDSSDFRMYWTYMPSFRILDKNDFMRTYAVYLMMFLFIFIICITATCVICYTRCRTIALNNRYVFDDLKKLGAPPAFLKREVRLQCRTVIQIPAIIGISAMSFLYIMIMYGNDGKLVRYELAGLGVCGLVVAGIALLLYLFYRRTVEVLARELTLEL